MSPTALKCSVVAFALMSQIIILAEARKSSNTSGRFQLAKKGRPGREGKLFSIFNVVTFQNRPCVSNAQINTGNRNGTCYTSTECNGRSGTSAGNCASGFGVCCVFTLTSGTVTENCSYIQNAGFPSALADLSSNSFTVQKCRADVCFLRLDFETFTLSGTNGSANDNEGVCTDTFTATVATSQVIPTICGENTGQHMYIDIGANSGDTANLAFTFDAAITMVDRTFDIKVTQIECSNRNRPRDSGCLQYHTGCTGRIQTFNYGNANDNHLNNQQYSICVRQEDGFCCVEYQVCPDQRGTLPGGLPSGFSFDGTQANSRVDTNCRKADNSLDFISIPASFISCDRAGGNGVRAVHTRYCGSFLNAAQQVAAFVPICDCTAPFTVDIYFNNVDDNNAATINASQSRGLCLDYRQIPC